MKYDGMYGFLLLAFSSFVAFVCGWLLNSTVLLHFCCCCYCYSIREFCDECMCVYVCQCRRMEFALTDQPTDRTTVRRSFWQFCQMSICTCEYLCVCVWVCAIVISLVDCVIHFIQNVNRSMFPFFLSYTQLIKGGEVRETDCLSQTICVFILQTRQKKDEIQ